MRSTPMSGTDVLLSDLDGVVYRGAEPVRHAANSLTECARSARVGFVTNSAARTAESISAHLRSLGMDVAVDSIITSAHAAAWLLPSLVDRGDTVLVVGSGSLMREIENAGYRVTLSASDEPALVVQGFSREITWEQLSQAASALRSDRAVGWVATNVDATVPSPRGLLLENGALVAAVAAAVSGRTPVVAGKPEVPIFRTALERFAATTALFVGDRLDTDVLGARRAGLRSALVLTGVDGLQSLLAAPPNMRPDFILQDLRGLNAPYEAPELSDDGSVCTVGATRVEWDGEAARVTRQGSQEEAVRAQCALVWHRNDTSEREPRPQRAR